MEKFDRMKHEMVHSAGAAMGKAEEKSLALSRAIKRKEHQLQVRTQSASARPGVTDSGSP